MHTGEWVSRQGVVLCLTCPKCGVLVGKDHRGRKVEFDSRPHVCKGVPFRQGELLL